MAAQKRAKPAPKKKTKPAVETRRFEEIIADRMPKQPTTRERLAAAVDARAESRAKLAAQEKAKAERKARNKKILAWHHGNFTSREYLRDVALADRQEAGR
jgi:hypothetical protein